MQHPSDLLRANGLMPVIGSCARTGCGGGQQDGFPRRGVANDMAPVPVEPCGARVARVPECPFAQPAHPRRRRGRALHRGASGKRALHVTARDRGQSDASSGPGTRRVVDVGRKG